MAKTKVNILASKVKTNNMCSKCDQIYKTVADQKRHEKAPKTGILLICQICFFKSCTESGLEIHNEQTHKNFGQKDFPSKQNSNLPMIRRRGGAAGVEDKNVLVPSVIKPRLIQKNPKKLQDYDSKKLKNNAVQKPDIIRPHLLKNVKTEKKAVAAAKNSNVILNCNFYQSLVS